MSESASERGYITIPCLALLILVLLLAWMNQQPPRTRKAKKTNHLMMAVMASNTVNHLIYGVLKFGCGFCAIRVSAYQITGAIVKGVNLLFLIHRAKLVQGMTPVIGMKWFEKRLPVLTIGLVIVFIFLIVKAQMASDWSCATTPDWKTVQQCSIDDRSKGQNIAIMGIALDFLITVFLMALFVVPLFRVYNTDIGVMNANQLKQRKKLRDLLIWSIVLTFVNQVSSSFKFMSVALLSETGRILYRIGLFDPAINVWTSWLMITRNRQYLKRIYTHICCAQSKEGLIKQQSVALSDIASVHHNSSIGLEIERQQSTSERRQYTSNPGSAVVADPSS